MVGTGEWTDLDRYGDRHRLFGVGSVRSGTSAMMHALRDGGCSSGFNEALVAQFLDLTILLAAADWHSSSFNQKPSM